MLITTGLLMFAFVAYQLWGTGIETARAQNRLGNEFEELLEQYAAPPTGAPSTTDTSVPDDPAPPVQELPPIEEGDPIGRLEIPAIGRDDWIVAGVSKDDLKQGPGHYPETPMPGQLGNAAIAGHRTTFGQPFFDIGELEAGDELVVTTLAGRFVYRVTEQQIVAPTDYHVIATTDPTRATLTLTSCHPKWTARERIVVTAELDAAASSAIPGAPTINYGRPLPPADVDDAALAPPTSDGAYPTGSADDAAAPDAVDREIADAFSEGWFSDPAAYPQVALWAIVLVAITTGAYLLARRLRRVWVGLVVGTLPFLVALYFFFQNVNRLLPPNL